MRFFYVFVFLCLRDLVFVFVHQRASSYVCVCDCCHGCELCFLNVSCVLCVLRVLCFLCIVIVCDVCCCVLCVVYVVCVVCAIGFVFVLCVSYVSRLYIMLYECCVFSL